MPSQGCIWILRLVRLKDCEVLEQRNEGRANDVFGLTSKEGGTAAVS